MHLRLRGAAATMKRPLRRLPQEVVGSNPTDAKICFSHFTLLEWNVKNCFVKLIKTPKNTLKNNHTIAETGGRPRIHVFKARISSAIRECVNETFNFATPS